MKTSFILLIALMFGLILSGQNDNKYQINHTSKHPVIKKNLLGSGSLSMNNIVACYPFNGDANDVGGHNLNGIVHGNVTLTTDRNNNPNSAYEFGGTLYDWIEVPDNSLLNIMPNFTISAWVYVEPGSNTWVLGKGRDLWEGTWALGLPYVKANCPSVNTASNPTQLDNEQWYMLTGVMDGAAGKLKFYQDGQLISEANISGAAYTDSWPLAIGRHLTFLPPNYTSDYWATPFKGKIDDIFIFNRALADTEITALYNFNTVILLSIKPDKDTTVCQNNPITLDAGMGFEIYSWSTGETTQEITIKNNTAGTYTYRVTVTDVGRTGSDSIHITVKPAPTDTINAIGSATICSGNNVKMSIKNYESGNNYQWMKDGLIITGSTRTSYPASETGSYNVLVSYTNNCSALTNNIEVNVMSLPQLTVKTTDAGCSINNGTATMDAVGNGSFTYLWSNGESTQSITDLGVGEYSVTVTDTNKCSSVSSALINYSAHSMPTDGLVAYYPFNGNANDESGNNLNGIIHGNVTLTTDRNNNPNSAYEFGGTLYDWIEVPDNSLLNIIPNFTVSAWVYIEPGSNAWVIGKGRDIWSGTWDLGIAYIKANTDNDYTAGNSSPLNNEQWYMLTGVMDGTAGKLRYYQDGQMITEVNIGPYAIGNNWPMSIGRHLTTLPPIYTDNWAFPFKGKIDDILIYNRVLTDSEVKALYSFTLKLSLGKDTAVCPNTSVTLNAGAGFRSYTWSTGDTTREITVSNNTIGINTYKVTVTACDASVSDSLKITVNSCLTLKGTLNYDNSSKTPLPNTLINLKNEEGTVVDTNTTNASGEYIFKNINSGKYLLEPKITKKWGGVNPVDALLANRNYIGKYSFSDNLQKIAADANGDKKINPTDALLINRRYIKAIKGFKAGDWVFSNDIIEIINSDYIYNINAICIGDVNGSYQP